MLFRSQGPGTLPCADTDNDGSADSPCGAATETAIGRFPWKQLGLADLRDGAGECLWYAVAPQFKNAANAYSVYAPRNANTVGGIAAYDGSGNPLAVPAGGIAAVIIAPGEALDGQTRTAAGSTACGGNTNAAAYLDAAGGISNATGNGLGRFAKTALLF
mgnify:CR=1 FL=1